MDVVLNGKIVGKRIFSRKRERLAKDKKQKGRGKKGHVQKSALWNRNRNFLTSGTGTETVSC